MVDDTGASPVVYYVHTDQLGTPQKITDGSADVVWDGVFDPFGNMVANTGANWGTGVWLSFTWEPTTPQTMPLRFPGQYVDSETALNQNWNRDYDPTIGRYVESDPVGLWGGVNTYAYVQDSPARFIDPWGFCKAASPPTNGQCSPGWLDFGSEARRMAAVGADTGLGMEAYGLSMAIFGASGALETIGLSEVPGGAEIALGGFVVLGSGAVDFGGSLIQGWNTGNYNSALQSGGALAFGLLTMGATSASPQFAKTGGMLLGSTLDFFGGFPDKPTPLTCPSN
jgi:RHS repeat-associated protein